MYELMSLDMSMRMLACTIVMRRVALDVFELNAVGVSEDERKDIASGSDGMN